MKADRHPFGWGILIAVVATGAASGDVISNFDFTGPPWTAPKESDFATFAANAPSVDTDLNSTTSILSNNPGSGAAYNGGGYSSFYVRDADLPTISPGIFSTSTTAGVGLNIANGDYTTPANYIAFTVTPDSGYETTYGSLDFFSSSFGGGDTYDIELRAVVGGGTEMTLGTYQRTMPAGSNNPVEAGTIDFADFTSNEPTEFRLYAYNLATDNGGFRLDDLVLNGTTLLVSGLDDLRMTAVTFDGSVATATWNSRQGKIYFVYFSTDLVSWEELDDSFASQGDSTTYTDNIEARFALSELPVPEQGFYRAQENNGG